MDLGVVTADSRGVIKSVNQHVCKMFGYAKEDLLHRKINMLMPSPYAEQHDAYLHRYELTHKSRLLGTCRVVEGKKSTGEVFALRLSLSKIESEEEGTIWVSLFEPVKDNQTVFTLDSDADTIIDCYGHPEYFGYHAKTLKGNSIRLIFPRGIKPTTKNALSPRSQQPTFGRTRNLVALHKNGKDTFLVSVVLREKTILTGTDEVGGQHSSTTLSDLNTPNLMPPGKHDRALAHSSGNVQSSLVLAVITPLERDIEAMATIDDRGIVRSCNSTFVSLFGYSSDEMIGRSIGSLISDLALPVLKAIAREKVLPDEQRRIIGKGFHVVLGLHRDMSVFPMKFSVDELWHASNTNNPPHPTLNKQVSMKIFNAADGQVISSREEGDDSSKTQTGPTHTSSILPPVTLYQCTLQRLRAEEEQDLVKMLTETYRDLDEDASFSGRIPNEGAIAAALAQGGVNFQRTEPMSLEQKAKREEEKPKDKDVPAGESPTTKRQQKLGSYTGAYVFDVTLGGGYFGKVKLAVHRFTGEKVAIKTLRKRQYDNIKMEYPPRELKLLMKLNHPNIYKLLDVVELEDRILMITEYCSGGELFDYMAKLDHFDDKESRRLFRQLTSAVDYMHLNGVVHRDLKLENLLLDENIDLKLIDLGLGNFFDRKKLLESFCGTADYASPELWQGKRYIGPEVDIWSMGVLLFVFLTGKMPFLSPRHAVMGDFFFPASPHVCDSAKELIRRMLVADSSKRATMEEVRNHPWVRGEDDTPPPRIFVRRLENLDREITSQMAEMLGFEESSIISALNHNEFNQYTTTYQLLYDKKQRVKALQRKYASSLTTKKDEKPIAAKPAQQQSHDHKDDKKDKKSDEEGLCHIS
eukprot:TRINITY_DN8897_c0_g1_i1.p1 TRINITY_DN8897_c0_g1~~TRINITY_DN8897_c0_g1_i1.p1  ORF type:complete len:864 (+),score=230.40 TRINITY_DN8897_c0_g1_i1:212-2803(+)